MYTEANVRRMTVSELKKVIKTNRWDTGKARLKKDLKQLIMDKSYNDTQLSGLSKLEAM